jgi:hypothetical protein
MAALFHGKSSWKKRRPKPCPFYVWRLPVVFASRTRTTSDAAFRHHNPFFAGDVQALIAGMEENGRQNPTN